MFTIVGILEAASPFLIAFIFDTLLNATAATFTIPGLGRRFEIPVSAGSTLLVLLVATTVVKAIAEYAGTWAITNLGQAVVRDLRNDVFERILHQPLRFFQFNPTGELISRVSADVERIQTSLRTFTILTSFGWRDKFGKRLFEEQEEYRGPRFPSSE